MKFWDDSLRICPKCKTAVALDGEERKECPKCGRVVWFYHFRQVTPPTPLPAPIAPSLWKNPTTTLLLIATAILAFATLFAIRSNAMIASACALIAIGFAAFAFLRHSEATKIEDQLSDENEVKQYAELMRARVLDVTRRYNSLLASGNQRIEYYYGEIYFQAELERNDAERLRLAAERDRSAVKHVETRIYQMADRLVQDHLKWVAQKLRADPENYQKRKGELTRTFDFVEGVGYKLPGNLRRNALDELKENYKLKVRESTLKEEQRRVQQRMREEERLRRERQSQLDEAERRERELQQRLDEALREHAGVYDAEIQELQRQLDEARASSERAKSMAQLTKVGHVYILSNIGSFGEGIFKVGMTRRLEPEHRVKELGDASVPFPFDVHAMISCDNAPSLENALHRELTRYRVNRINLRKEYFNVDLATIISAVERHHGQVEYIAQPEALQFRETQSISPDELVDTEQELLEMGVDFEDDGEDS